jgi:hypothetical protein
MLAMRRIQIHIEEGVDDALAGWAAREGTSKAALIRRLLAERVRPVPAVDADPVTGLIGRLDEEPGDVDEVVYGS